MSLEYEPASEPMHISVKQLFLNRELKLQTIHYRGTSLIRISELLGLYGRHVPRALWWSYRMNLAADLSILKP